MEEMIYGVGSIIEVYTWVPARILYVNILRLGVVNIASNIHVARWGVFPVVFQLCQSLHTVNFINAE
jgi:hypothetical protein